MPSRFDRYILLRRHMSAAKIITDNLHQVLKRVIFFYSGRLTNMKLAEEITTMKVKDVLDSQKTPVTIQADKHLQDAMRLLIDNKIGSLVVVDEDDTPTGIITEHDIFTLAYRFRGDMMDMPVGDNMSRELLLGAPDDDIDKIVDIMLKNHIRHIPITDGNKKLIGIISIRDLVKIMRK